MWGGSRRLRPSSVPALPSSCCVASSASLYQQEQRVSKTPVPSVGYMTLPMSCIQRRVVNKCRLPGTAECDSSGCLFHRKGIIKRQQCSSRASVHTGAGRQQAPSAQQLLCDVHCMPTCTYKGVGVSGECSHDLARQDGAHPCQHIGASCTVQQLLHDIISISEHKGSVSISSSCQAAAG